MTNIQDTLIKYGLEPSTAEIYIILANNGEMTVPQIKEKTALSRASIYDSLNQLLAQDYASYRKDGRVAYYRPAHPDKLFGLIEQKKHEVTLLEKEMKDNIKALIGAYNLAENRPGVRFFEGEEGIREVWWDSLDSVGPIYTYGDLEFLAKHFEKLNAEYVAERTKRGIKKRAITNDSEFNRNFLKHYDATITETHLMADLPMDFSSVVMQIYDNKISYTSLSGESKTGVIIEDKKIYEMQKNLFEFNWQMLEVRNSRTSIQPQAQAEPPLLP